MNPPQDETPEIYETAKLFGDGGSRGNPGPSASGYVILTMNDEIILERGVYLGNSTNNQAEYKSLKFGLEDALKLGVKRLFVYMDSQLVIRQVNGQYRVKNYDLKPIYQAVIDLAAKFDKISFDHVPREFNKLADAQVNKSLDAKSNV